MGQVVYYGHIKWKMRPVSILISKFTYIVSILHMVYCPSIHYNKDFGTECDGQWHTKLFVLVMRLDNALFSSFSYDRMLL